MSPLELVDDRFEKLAQELRAARPVAPEELRERVRGLAPAPRRRFDLNFRRLVPAAGFAALTGAVAVAAVLGIVRGSTTRLNPLTQQRVVHGQVPNAAKSAGLPVQARPYGRNLSTLAPLPGRLQQYDAFLRVRVRDQDELSKQTQDAVRFARSLGGYVVWARYAAPGQHGDSELALRIPVDHVQAAIEHFSRYGSLVGQRVVLKDLQQLVDNLSARLRLLEADIAKIEHELGVSSTPAKRALLGQRLQVDRMKVAGLRSEKLSAVRRAQFARVALTMVVGKKPAAASSRFGRSMHEAASVLGRELEILLYALIVAGPLLAIGALGILGGRVFRRRADRRLLERS